MGKAKEMVFGIAFLQKDKKVYGIRTLTTDFENSKKIVDKTLDDLVGVEMFNMAVNKKKEIESIAREAETYAISKGKKTPSLTKYPIVNKDTSKIENKSFIILCRTKQGDETGFAMADANGNIKFMTEKEAIKLVKGEGGKDAIANGTLTSEGVIKNTVGYYYEVEKIGIINKQEGKEWDLADESKSVDKHINAILENKAIVNKITKKQDMEVFKTLFNDKKYLTDLVTSVSKDDTQKLGIVLTDFYNKYEVVLNNCENGKAFKQGIAKMMKGSKDTEFIKKVKRYIKEDVKIEDYFEG